MSCRKQIEIDMPDWSLNESGILEGKGKIF